MSKAKAAADAKERERKEKPVGKATIAELADELDSRDDATDGWIANRFSVDPWDEGEWPADHGDEIRDIYEAVAEGRTKDALTALHELFIEHVSLRHPKSMLNLAQRAA